MLKVRRSGCNRPVRMKGESRICPVEWLYKDNHSIMGLQDGYKLPFIIVAPDYVGGVVDLGYGVAHRQEPIDPPGMPLGRRSRGGARERDQQRDRNGRGGRNRKKQGEQR